MQAFCHKPLDRLDYDGHVDAAYAAAVKRSRVSATLTSLVMLLTFGAVGAVLWFGVQDLLAGRMSGGELSAFVFFAAALIPKSGFFASR